MYAVDGEPYEAPNYTQIPNRFLDEQLADLSGSETKVLLYIMRRTYGFDKGSDAISLKQIAEGIKRKDGTPLDGGTGLSVPTVVSAIKGLVKRGLILKEHRSSKEKGDQANLYRLNAVHSAPSKKIEDGPSSNSEVPLLKNTSGPLKKSETQKKVGQKKDRQQKESIVEAEDVEAKRTNARTLTDLYSSETISEAERVADALELYDLSEKELSRICRGLENPKYKDTDGVLIALDFTHYRYEQLGLLASGKKSAKTYTDFISAWLNQMAARYNWPKYQKVPGTNVVAMRTKNQPTSLYLSTEEKSAKYGHRYKSGIELWDLLCIEMADMNDARALPCQQLVDWNYELFPAVRQQGERTLIITPFADLDGYERIMWPATIKSVATETGLGRIDVLWSDELQEVPA